jgi:hypothetical protein
MSAFNPVPLWRRLLVGMAGALGGVVFITLLHNKSSGELAIPVLALFVAAVVIHLPSLGAQLLARAVWWANLGLGAIVCVLGGHTARPAGLMLAVACGFALLAVGKEGLGEAGEREGYAPAAFRSSLLLLMVLALADAQTFLLFTVLAYNDRDYALPTLMLLAPATVAYGVGFVGLYRLAPWGAVLNALTSAVVFILALSQLSGMDSGLRTIVLTLTGVHALATAPMLLSLFTGVRLPQTSPRLRERLAIAVVLGVVAVSTAGALELIGIR